MSGIGKSHLSRLLAARGWRWHDCDREIAARIAVTLPVAAGDQPVHALGRWMGMPWTPGYSERERRYLDLEAEVTREALAAALAEATTPQVIDATGSVIYLDRDLLDALHLECTVVYLRAPEDEREALLALYLREPKPVVWGGAFTAARDQTPEAALPRSYTRLLDERDRGYTALAHITLGAKDLRSDDPVQHLLGALRTHLGP